jgi:sugar phosphate isomerase/epimerase
MAPAQAGEQPKRSAGPFALRHVLPAPVYHALDLAQVVPQVRAAGMEAIDVWGLHGIEKMGQDAFAELLKKHGVKLAYVTLYLGPGKGLPNLQPYLPNVKKTGTSCVITGFMPKTKEDMVAYMERVQGVVAQAEELGLSIAVENYGHSPDVIRSFAEHAKSDRLGIILAPYHMERDPKQIADLVRDLGKKLFAIYLWQRGAGTDQLPGVGTGRQGLDFGPIVAALKETNYQGWSEVFMHGKAGETVEEITEVFARARKHVDELAARA